MSRTTAGPEARKPELTPDQRRQILRTAQEIVAATIQGRPARLDDPSLAGAADRPVMGAFVTLKRKGHLRACCGFLADSCRLSDAVRHAALRTATEDLRLPPISATELPFLVLDVNLLQELKPVEARGRDRIAAVEVGRHGLRIEREDDSGLLLPSVATEHGWDAETFLRHVCRKAGLPTTAWEDDETGLSTFETIEFGGPFDAAGPDASRAGFHLRPDELAELAAHASRNVQALARGQAPNHYLSGVADGNLCGLALTVTAPGLAESIHLAQLSLRPGLPLQATLFRLCEAAAQVLARSGIVPESVRVGVTILSDPALHGTVQAPDLRGLDPSRRALLLLENEKSAWVFAPDLTPDGLLAAVRNRFDILQPEAAGLYSLEAQSTEARVVFSSAPRPVATAQVRPPAVAGTFYPDDADELSELADRLLAASDRRAEPWPAAMVPHAGLIYSGRLAAAVFNRLEFPDTILILGPKHTRYGMNWAVAPCEAWSLPGATLAADPALARALAEAIPGLAPDAAAHRQEHAIEVELPFLAKLAPRSKVVGLAIGAASWEHCQAFARGLADVLRRLPTRPLLVISSDMNHFATDRENRRLDEIALRAMERLDPADLLRTVREHDISMCGVLPAVIVMETLRQLGGLTACERVGYATSAEVSGDTRRVVGYAGMLLR